MEFPFASRYTDHHDLVLVGYRGVDGSSRLDCPEVDRRAPRTTPTSSASARSRVDAARSRACADRLREDGVDLGGYSIAAARRRPRGRAQRARLRPRRPAQRERRHARRDGLRAGATRRASTAR